MMHDHQFPATGCRGAKPFGSAEDNPQAAGQPAPPALPPRSGEGDHAQHGGGAQAASTSCIPAPYVPAPYVPVRAVEDVLALRMRQIHHFGHTPEKDCALPLRALPMQAQRAGQAVQDDVHFKPSERATMRKHALKAASLWLAFVDRLDAEAAADAETTAPQQDW